MFNLYYIINKLNDLDVSWVWVWIEFAVFGYSFKLRISIYRYYVLNRPYLNIITYIYVNLCNDIHLYIYKINSLSIFMKMHFRCLFYKCPHNAISL